MPAKKLKTRQGNLTLDARPDRPDIRDRPYAPPLKPLPRIYPDPQLVKRYLELYQEDGMVLDQGTEGACTGFGLAAVINYLLWSQLRLAYDARTAEARASEPWRPPVRVSERMLYHLARVYDEWPGEDYDGSSARGAMKGWYHHGVCNEMLWPYRNPKTGKETFLRPAEDESGDAEKDWRANASFRPLGAYYRVDKYSHIDMQAAIAEVGAIYVSASVHKGWDLARSSGKIPTIDPKHKDKPDGGHAFALMGYDEEGFIVQNSWGPRWGYNGFARLTYQDWLANGADAWVANMGARTTIPAPSLMLSSTRTVPAAISRLGRGAALAAVVGSSAITPALRKWNAGTIENHALAIGNDGRPMTISVTHGNAEDAARVVCLDRPRTWLAKQKKGERRLALYCHGGLNDLAEGLTRTSIMAPCFADNGVWPIFAVWQSGAFDTIGNLLEDQVEREKGKPGPSGNIFERIVDSASEISDRFLEAAIARPLAKPLWTEMKENAQGASAPGGGLTILARAAQELAGEFPDLELHLIGHSAGAIMLGAFVRAFGGKVKAASCSLFAPACTAAFANATFGAALKSGALDPKRFSLDILSDVLEREDRVGPYGKSLLYLVSRALEPDHKAPILGMQAMFDKAFADENDIFNDDLAQSLADWRGTWSGIKNRARLNVLTKRQVRDGEGAIPANHGSFDNAIEIVGATIERIRGGKLLKQIGTLRGF